MTERSRIHLARKIYSTQKKQYCALQSAFYIEGKPIVCHAARATNKHDPISSKLHRTLVYCVFVIAFNIIWSIGAKKLSHCNTRDRMSVAPRCTMHVFRTKPPYCNTVKMQLWIGNVWYAHCSLLMASVYCNRAIVQSCAHTACNPKCWPCR